MKLEDTVLKSRDDKRLNLLDAKRIFDSLGVTFWLSNGTLLGFYRENDFIEHDPDIDVGVWQSDWDPVILVSFLSNGFKLYREYGFTDTGLQYSLYKRDIKFDIFFYVKEEDHSWMPVFVGNTRMLKYRFPLFELKTITFLDEQFQVPDPTEDVIVAQYGEDWRHPIVEWSYVTSPHNVYE